MPFTELCRVVEDIFEQVVKVCALCNSGLALCVLTGCVVDAEV